MKEDGHKPLVLVKWLDSHYVAGWHTEEPDIDPLVCHSVGWLVYDGEESIVVAGHMTDEDTPQRCGEMTIPRAMIKSIAFLDCVTKAPIRITPLGSKDLNMVYGDMNAAVVGVNQNA